MIRSCLLRLMAFFALLMPFLVLMSWLSQVLSATRPDLAVVHLLSDVPSVGVRPVVLQRTYSVTRSAPYMVLGSPTVMADFINQVLYMYHSPAAGRGQSLYDLGEKSGIDPAFALAFFMHESSFGTRGEAAKSLSLGNLRCIPHFRCQDNFAQFDTWEDGFQAWYELIHNLYIVQWGLTTVDQIIPRYAPQADHNNEQAYIAALKHALDTWHAGQVVVQ